MTKKIVTDEQYGKLSKRAHELLLRVSKGAVDFEVAYGELQHLLEGKEISLIPSKTKEDWLSGILTCEHDCYSDFFGKTFDLTGFVKTLEKYGRQQIARWVKLGLEPHYFPKVGMMPEDNYRDWNIKPEAWYYNQVANGKILRNQNGELVAGRIAELEGITVLIDTRLKPAYNEGRQMWADDDFLGSIIAELRKQGKIAKYDYGPHSSRFGDSADEWEIHIKPIYAAKLGLSSSQLRLEFAIEANVIPQLYLHMPRKDDGKTNTWVWYEEYFEDRDRRLLGGYSVYGGLARVGYDWVACHWSRRSFRPLAVL